jgi:hypothetical protein
MITEFWSMRSHKAKIILRIPDAGAWRRHIAPLDAERCT